MSQNKSYLPPAKRDHDEPHKSPPRPTTQQLGRALVAIAGLRTKLKEHLSMLPNAVNRGQIDGVFKESMRDLVTEISHNEDLL